jgi:hypothetical protein
MRESDGVRGSLGGCLAVQSSQPEQEVWIGLLPCHEAAAGLRVIRVWALQGRGAWAGANLDATPSTGGAVTGASADAPEGRWVLMPPGEADVILPEVSFCVEVVSGEA